MTGDERDRDRKSAWRRIVVFAIVFMVALAELHAHWVPGLRGHSIPDKPRTHPPTSFPEHPGRSGEGEGAEG